MILQQTFTTVAQTLIDKLGQANRDFRDYLTNNNPNSFFLDPFYFFF